MARADSDQLSELSRALLRIPVPWVFVLTYLVGAALEAVFHQGRWLDSPIVSPAGGVIFLIGVGVAASGWLRFHRAGTTRVPGETSTTLVTWGPYRMTRNPMYLGLSIAYVGEAGLLHQIIPVILLPLTILYLNRVVIPVEENRLRAAFGAEYDQYAGRVHRWF
jgi:protein-S-isoprenylcysteine O-methyltransferase Ste14